MDQRPQMLDLIRANQGFEVAEQWLDYGIQHNFQQVNARRRDTCPDCGGKEAGCLGQYVYYSNLIRLRECDHCGLVFSDVLIDPRVLQRHFERSYKDEDYFNVRRRRIFKQVAALVDRHTPIGGRVLDIGGAKGHLLATIKQQRPDIKASLNDISHEACRSAATLFQLETFCGDIDVLEQLEIRFDTVIMSDVLYYEPHLRRTWARLPTLLTEGGCVIIRVPNRLPLIRLAQGFAQLTQSPGERALQDQISFFNPEHIYVFTPRYLSTRLQHLGFSRTQIIPSERLAKAGRDSAQSAWFRFASALAWLSRGKLIATPSFLLVGEKSSE